MKVKALFLVPKINLATGCTLVSCLAETSVHIRTTRLYIPEGSNSVSLNSCHFYLTQQRSFGICTFLCERKGRVIVEN